MGASLGSKGGPIADINVTPLIDVVLVLLVVFMVITPLLQSGQNVDLPQATQAEKVNDVGQFVVISVTQGKGIWVAEEQVSDTIEVNETSLMEAVYTELNTNSQRMLLVKADKNLKYREVRAVLDVLAKNRMTNVLIAAQKEE